VSEPAPAPVLDAEATDEVEVRIEAEQLAVVREHVEDFMRGEEAGYLVCSVSQVFGRAILLAREWRPVPEWAIERNAHGSVLSWSAKFNGEALQRAFDLDGTLVLIHSHGTAQPRFSDDDRQKEPAFFAPASRMLDPFPTGSILLGKGDAAGTFWRAGVRAGRFRRLVVLGETIESWRATELQLLRRERLTRLAPVIGPEGDAKVADARVAVIGISGGGSHVVQQLAHQGVGAIIAIDDDTIDESNLGRVVGATYIDIDKTKKTDLAERIATAIDPGIRVVKVKKRFPSADAIAALKSADIIVGCVDTFRAREAINLFCRRYMIPLVDIGVTLDSRGERLIRADGQLIVTMPGRPCMRCWFLTDAVLDREQRERPAGYNRNPNAPGDPQVVSMNGTLASEACNCVLDLITSYSGGERGARWWIYDGRSGQLDRQDLPPGRPDCPACAELGLGDPART
jgi:molybdopterin/thiamine biosynthesis adenylyltransferase/proteasome lid subunit RPN8/RPN11